MESQALGTPLVPNRTVKDVMDVITKCQGGFIVGDGDVTFEKVADEIEGMLHGSSSSSGSGLADPSEPPSSGHSNGHSNGTNTTTTQHLLLPPPPPSSTTGYSSSPCPVLRRSNSGTSSADFTTGSTSLVELQASLEAKEREIAILKAIIVTKDMQLDELKMAGLRL